MFTETMTPIARSPRANYFAKRIRAKELIPMCIIHIENTLRDPSMLELARRCKRILEADISPELEVAFVGLSPEGAAHLSEFRAKHELFTLGDWTIALRKILIPGSDYCPNCGLKSFTIPTVYCECCGANPGIVFENAGGVFPSRSP